ncbi:MAG: hypothetical protein ACAI44_40735 [Candidatus Sericytochromatia bacterium]
MAEELLSHLLEPDYYALLEVAPEATRLEVEERFHERTSDLSLGQRLGSARVEAAEILLILTQSYEVLSDPMLRSHYDIRRFGRENLPLAEQVQQLFRSGVKSYRAKRLELALRYFKEASRLYPHRSLFRVHLAVVYAEKQWLTNAENELETALRLDPEDRFAKEMIARLLFDFETFTRAERQPLLRRMGTGLLSLVRTGPLAKGQKTDKL